MMPSPESARAASFSVFQWGKILGEISLPPAAQHGAAELAQQHFDQAEALDFSGTEVEDYLPPASMESRWEWFPYDRVRELGFEPVSRNKEAVYGTVGVGMHEDDMFGPCFILTLFNDGLCFRMKDQEHVTAVGQWFILDDRQPHEVQETEDSTTYLVWSVPLRELA
ncbi:hypothetical protein [Ralstonia pseudosolanacearum]|uniref:hypothetical protein n=1 Tax=Ralstonia pseudosolanacearum TaxID=1310165 RepID=UPI003CF36352